MWLWYCHMICEFVKISCNLICDVFLQYLFLKVCICKSRLCGCTARLASVLEQLRTRVEGLGLCWILFLVFGVDAVAEIMSAGFEGNTGYICVLTYTIHSCQCCGFVRWSTTAVPAWQGCSLLWRVPIFWACIVQNILFKLMHRSLLRYCCVYLGCAARYRFHNCVRCGSYILRYVFTWLNVYRIS